MSADLGALAEWSVAVGEVRRPHGVHGEVAVTPLTDRPERFGELETVAAFPPGAPPRLCRVLEWRPMKDYVLLRLEGVSDRDCAEPLRGATLRVRPEMRYELAEDEYWVDDLVGVAVVTDDGRDLGAIREVLSLPANDVYVTEHCLIPAIKDVLVSVDVSARRMVVRPMPGLAPELGI